MANLIKLRKSFKINLKGKAPLEITHVKEQRFYSLVHVDFTCLTTRVV